MRFRLVIAAGLVVLLAGLARPVSAGQTIFNPAVELDAGYEENVELGEGDGASDTTATLGVDLPLEHNWGDSSFALRYNPSYVKHADVGELDRDEHRLDLGLSTGVGRSTSLELSAGYTRRQEQAVIDFTEVPDSVDDSLDVTARTNRESLHADLSVGRTQSPRWNWEASIGLSSLDHETIDGLPPPQNNPVQDRSEFGGGFDISRSLTRNTLMGFEFGHSEYRFPGAANDERSDLVGLTFDHALDRQLVVGWSIGAARTSGEDVADSTGFQGSFGLSRSFRRVALGLAASHRPTSGGHLEGTSTNSRFSVSMSGNVLTRWSWNTAVRFDRREPTDAADPTREIVALGVGLERSFGSILGLRFGLNAARQDDRSETREVRSASIGMVYYPRGRAVRARGEQI